MGGISVRSAALSGDNDSDSATCQITFLTQALVAKRIEVLHQAVPAATSIGYLVNPMSPQTAVNLKEAENAERVLGVRLVIFKATTPSEIEAAFGALAAQGIGALCVDTDNFFTVHGFEIAALATRHGVPAIFGFRDIVENGGLMSYGTDPADAYHVAGSYAGRILKGEKPGNLPVQRATKVELTINLKTAKALGVSFPLTLLGRADVAIE